MTKCFQSLGSFDSFGFIIITFIGYWSHGEGNPQLSTRSGLHLFPLFFTPAARVIILHVWGSEVKMSMGNGGMARNISCIINPQASKMLRRKESK